MPTRMTSRERMLAALHHAPVDRVPVSPWGLGRINWDSPLGAELVARTDPWLEIGLGADAVGGAAFPVDVAQRGNQTRRVIHAPGRDLTWVMTTTEHSTACTEYPCKTVADIEALLAIPYVTPHVDLAAWRAWRARVGQDGLAVMSVGDGLCYPNDVLGTEFCSLLWASEPEIIVRLVSTAAERAFRLVEEACRGGVDLFRIVGGEYATQLMGRRAWTELIVAYDRPLIEMIHSYGALAHYHNHGDMQRFIADLAALDIDSLDPIEQPPYGDLALDEAQRRIGDRVCLVGGLDDMEVLETRPTAEVQRLAADLLARMAPTGWMLGGTSSGIYSEPAARNFIALVEVAERAASK